ncbi:unnamed protein product [Peniophora sp. CBMAI 1063]|nr:unnamed protein product [Peniophora sp. CBMAI 1063]
MDPNTHAQYESLLSSLPNAQRRQTARDLRLDHIQALGSNIMLTALNARLQQDLETERREHAEEVGRVSSERDDVVLRLDEARRDKLELEAKVKELNDHVKKVEREKEAVENVYKRMKAQMAVAAAALERMNRRAQARFDDFELRQKRREAETKERGAAREKEVQREAPHTDRSSETGSETADETASTHTAV